LAAAAVHGMIGALIQQHSRAECVGGWMQRSAVLAKTEKGAEEVKSRAYGLPARLRSVLIMVDGVSSVGDLVERFNAIPNIEGSLQLLLEQEYVALSGTDAGAAQAPAAAPARATPDAAPDAAPQPPVPATRERAVSELCLVLLDSAGPNADLVTGDLERARNRAEFEKAVARAANLLEAMGGRARPRAAEFRVRAQVVAERFFGA
jgi:hypothetical protein